MLNTSLSRLVNIGQKPERLIIGLMSGTSLDGLDIALCRFSGNGFDTRFELLEFTTVAYTDTFKEDVRQVFAKKQVDLEKLCLLNASIGSLHADMILEALNQWDYEPADVDLIASHGQTIYHAPKRLHHLPNYPNATLQIGDGDHIAVKTGIITLSDFRQKHIAAGGEGAPLALYGDILLGSHPTENRILLNMGGIANLTWLPASKEGVICTDVGPGNTLIDCACLHYFNKPYDENGAIAFSGIVNMVLLDELLKEPFFTETVPKTTGPELFSWQYVKDAQQRTGSLQITPEDLIATLSTLTAEGIVRFIQSNITSKVDKLFTSGGGAKNDFIIQYLQNALPDVEIANTDVLGINADAKEAILFALLANEAIVGEPIKIGDNPEVLMGKICFPV